jgi:cell division protein FtsW
MIFSVICEELGVVGAAAVLLIFALILYRMVFIAKNAQSRFGGLLTAGVFIHIALQVVLNVMVASNLFPPTGITLPFISYGGSATLCLLFEIGMVFRVSREIVLEEA